MNDNDRRVVCEAFGRTIRDLVAQYPSPRIHLAKFVKEVLTMEENAVRPAGLVLTAADTRDGWVCFSLHVRGTGKLCARFECRLDTGEFRQIV